LGTPQRWRIRIARDEVRKREALMNEKIRIIVNDVKEEVPADSTISHLIKHFKKKDGFVVVELNGQFILQQKYAETAVTNGDRIIFIPLESGG